MRATDVVYSVTRLRESKRYGRAFNHLEDLVFFYGSQGAAEALEHLREVGTEDGAGSMRLKWDGYPQVYFGRDNGKLVLAGHNGWLRGAKTTSPEEIEDFIANKSGSPKTPQEIAARNKFAKRFASWYLLFDKAVPRDFEGYVYADTLFDSTPQLVDGVYSFGPNPHSETQYHVKADSELGQQISRAQMMIVGHAFFPEFGMPDHEQQPMTDFSIFNTTPDLIVLGPVYNKTAVEVDDRAIDKAQQYIEQHGQSIDSFLTGMKGLSDLKEIIYRFVNQTAKAKRLDDLSSELFYEWLDESPVSANKQQRIRELDEQNGGVTGEIFTLVKLIQDAKNSVIEQVEGQHGDIWDTNGEGRVRYGDDTKQFGNVKFVPRHRWTP